jgi:hypothetical protein
MPWQGKSLACSDMRHEGIVAELPPTCTRQHVRRCLSEIKEIMRNSSARTTMQREKKRRVALEWVGMVVKCEMLL